MKKLVLFCFLVVSAWHATAAEFDGYIVKIKEGKSLSTKGIHSIHSTIAGDFAVVRDQKSLGMLESDPAVEFIEPNYIIAVNPLGQGPLVDAKDSKFSQQWGLKNTGWNSGSILSPGRRGEDINAEPAWRRSRGSRNVVVAIIDTGIDYTHQDIAANMLVNQAEKDGQPGVDDDGNGYIDDVYGYDFAGKDGDPQDGHGHGTHCAGVIGAVHDDYGIRGVMANVKMIGVKFLSDSGSGSTADAILAVDYAVKRGANVLSNSWGGGGRSQALFDVIEAANEAGAIFVAAAGNSRRDNDTTETYPANYDVDNVISVGAMDGAGKKASFSNYGDMKVHVFAPGVNILSTVPGGHKKMSGTSMACPHVSGIVGLLLAERPNLTPAQVKELLIETSTQTSSLRGYSQSHGRVHATNALERALEL